MFLDMRGLIRDDFISTCFSFLRTLGLELKELTLNTCAALINQWHLRYEKSIFISTESNVTHAIAPPLRIHTPTVDMATVLSKATGMLLIIVCCIFIVSAWFMFALLLM